jgi:DNA-binding CsgD family transcriptional regulator
MPVDALVMAATDPDTSLALGAGIVRDMPHTVCMPFWEYEFEVPDFNKFSDLARAPRQVADLHAATGGRPERSARWREFRTLMDADAELRATFTAGGRGWGLMHLNRAGTTRGFSSDEVDFVQAIAPIVGRALRLSLISQPAGNDAGRGPGMAIVDAENRLVSATPEALAWFEEIESIYLIPDPVLGRDVPSEVTVAAREARARATASFDGAWAAAAHATATRTRARTRNGVWLLIHASCLQRADGTASDAAVVIEPAKASEVAPLIVDAYELTPREVDVTRALARGLSTNEIAAELHLSRYTVQDHLKSVYEKAGVSSRGELVAKMFADHYHDGLAAALHGGPAAGPELALAA